MARCGIGKSLAPDSGGLNPPIAIVANLTAVAANRDNLLDPLPADTTQPLSYDLNPRAGDVVANCAFVGIATTGAASGNVALYNAAGTINAILDVAGWFQ